MKKQSYLIGLLLLFVLSACGESDTTPPDDKGVDKNSETEPVAGNQVIDPIFEAQAGDLHLSDAWFRSSQAGDTTELYVTIENGGTDEEILADILVSGVLPLMTSVEFYNGAVADENILSWIEIAAGEKVELKPGGYMIHLEETSKDLNAGDVVNVDLHFMNAGDVSIDAEVRD